jgi:hypothetical protein
MRIFSRRPVALFAISSVLVLSFNGFASPAPPNPILIFIGSENLKQGGSEFTRYHFDVFNKEAFPAEMFAASPNLSPCGVNKNASRTWVDLYEQNGKRLNGFCAPGKPSNLNGIWFALPSDEIPPSWIYIEFTDRLTNTKYKSNLVETTM